MRKKSGMAPRMALVAALAAFCAAGALSADGVDAVTSASRDAETGASKQLAPVAVSGDFSVAYALNDDGALFIMARDLAEAYGRDELASDALFKGKVVRVKGEVEKASKPDADKPWLTLLGGGASGKRVRCSLKKGELSGGPVGPGTVVQVRGVCDGMKLSVSVVEGEIVD
ncbi:MAG: OB-fold putative lipoprotein [Planctomycetota bacterium]|jgi:hypothetical protein|nr:OB-fold putative lipoprotein [Planctomycetota bacterium]